MSNNMSDSVYCEICSGCGIEGCCSPLSCMKKCMIDLKPEKCLHGEAYYKDLEFSYILLDSILELIEQLKNNEINQNTFIERYDEEFERVYKDIYVQEKGVDNE